MKFHCKLDHKIIEAKHTLHCLILNSKQPNPNKLHHFHTKLYHSFEVKFPLWSVMSYLKNNYARILHCLHWQEHYWKREGRKAVSQHEKTMSQEPLGNPVFPRATDFVSSPWENYFPWVIGPFILEPDWREGRRRSPSFLLFEATSRCWQCQSAT